MTPSHAEPSGHPSPHRSRAGLAALLYGLIAAPLAWIIGQIVDATLAQEACFPGTEPLSSPAIANLQVVHAVVLAAALMVTVSAAVVAFGAWRATRDEQAGGSHVLLSIGEGRSRFMALAGVLTSLGFLVGTLFTVPALLFVPAC